MKGAERPISNQKDATMIVKDQNVVYDCRNIYYLNYEPTIKG